MTDDDISCTAGNQDSYAKRIARAYKATGSLAPFKRMTRRCVFGR